MLASGFVFAQHNLVLLLQQVTFCLNCGEVGACSRPVKGHIGHSVIFFVCLLGLFVRASTHAKNTDFSPLIRVWKLGTASCWHTHRWG